MKVRHHVAFGELALANDEEEGVPPIMVAADAVDECGCHIIVGHKMTDDILERAAELSRRNAPIEEYHKLHKDSLSVGFAPCENDIHREIMRRALLRYHDTIGDESYGDRECIDVAVELLEAERAAFV